MTDKSIWRVLPWRKDDPYTCMAIDKVIAETVATSGPPTIRFYHWSGNGAVSYGASQAMTDFDTAYCEQEGIQYVRRFTEARTMYHGSSDLTYAIAVPVSLYGTRVQLGAFTSLRIISFLECIGIKNAEQAGYTSIMINGRKISGSVPHFEGKRALFQHGSVFCDLEYEKVARTYGCQEEELLSTTTSVNGEMAGKKILPGSLEDIFQDCFLANENWEEDSLTEQEQEKVNEWRRVFATEEWFSAGREPRGVCSMHHGSPIPRLVTTFLSKR